jgi:hypothetical protein
VECEPQKKLDVIFPSGEQKKKNTDFKGKFVYIFVKRPVGLFNRRNSKVLFNWSEQVLYS